MNLTEIRKASVAGVALLLAGWVMPVASQVVQPLPAVLVTAPTPLQGFGVPRDWIAGNLSDVDGDQVRRASPGAGLPELLSGHFPSVHANDYQGNPLQADVSYRGFTASPLLGTPQGLSVYQDGVRINEPFGDVVHWDLVPMHSLAGITLVPGSNPLFGANTLGGALVMRTKSGDSHPGADVEAAAGNFGRGAIEFEYGRPLAGGSHIFLSGSRSVDGGWRDFSPSDASQVFAKFGRRTPTGEFEVALTAADSDLIGNGLVPASMLVARRQAIFTRPDNTRNRMEMLAFNGSLFLIDQSQLSALLYHRRNRTRTLNGDANDDFEGSANDGDTGANGGLGFNVDTAAKNRTTTDQTGWGGGLQWSTSAGNHQWLVGAAYDASNSSFGQSTQTGIFDATRGVLESGPEVIENRLTGRTRMLGLFVSDTVRLASDTRLSISGRMNWARVTLRDVGPTAPAMNGDHLFRGFNPALGVTQGAGSATLYAGLSQGSRAPTPVELGCADPANPCTLPNAMAADPPLKQVVARTLEFGARGPMGAQGRWNAGFFQTDNRDDILFVGTTTSAGYFMNYGKTRRRGMELALSADAGRWEWKLGYTYLLATFRSAACLLAQNNSSRGGSTLCTPADGSGTGDDLIAVAPGNRMPGAPVHNLKLGLSFRPASGWSLGAEVIALSNQYVRGNENNAHRTGTHSDVNGVARTFAGPGTVAGHAIVNLSARGDLGAGWEIMGRVTNLFDRRFATGGALAENPFDSAGNFQTNSGNWSRETFFAPGTPRTLWIGVRYRLGAG